MRSSSTFSGGNFALFGASLLGERLFFFGELHTIASDNDAIKISPVGDVDKIARMNIRRDKGAIENGDFRF